MISLMQLLHDVIIMIT